MIEVLLLAAALSLLACGCFAFASNFIYMTFCIPYDALFGRAAQLIRIFKFICAQ